MKPEVVAGEGMRLGDCVIETELGSVDLGIRSQLGEIERGFFDRAGSSRSEPTQDRHARIRCNGCRHRGAGVRMSSLLDRYFARLERGQPWRWRGQVLESVGQTIESAGPLASVGECCEIQDQFGRAHLAEVIGFRGSNVLSMPVETHGGNSLRRSGVRRWDVIPRSKSGPALMGRVLNALGEPIDEGRPPAVCQPLPLEGAVRSPLDRAPIRTPLGTGIRVLDALLTVGRGPARGHLRRLGRGQEHADRHDDPQHRGRRDGGGPGGRARPRSGRVS